MMHTSAEWTRPGTSLRPTGSRIWTLGIEASLDAIENSGAQLDQLGEELGRPEVIRDQPRTRFDRAHFAEYGDFSLVFEVVYYVIGSDYNLYMDTQQAINLVNADQGIFLDSGHFDYVLKGEAEETLPRFLQALEAGDDKAIGEVPGLAGVREGQIWVDNPAPPLIKKLDELPMPARAGKG